MAYRQKHIFVVDDDEVTAEMICDHLRENPFYKVSCFSTGEDCIRNLDMEPDVVILDYRLNSVKPDAADGLAILEQIKHADSSICVIMLSSQEQYGRALQSIIKGALEYVVKDNEAPGKIDHILLNLFHV